MSNIENTIRDHDSFQILIFANKKKAIGFIEFSISYDIKPRHENKHKVYAREAPLRVGSP